MFKILSITSLILIPTLAHSICFNFVNGAGPDRMGNVMFDQEAAKKICISQVNTRRQWTSVDVSDSQGPVLRIAVNMSTGRCGADRYCRFFQGLSGQSILGNLSAGDADSIKFSIDAQTRANLGLKLGSLKVDGRSYNVIEAK